MNTKELLREVIHDELEKLKEMEVGTNEYKATVDGVVKLTAQLNDMTKIEAEALENAEKRKDAKAEAEFEHEFKKTQAEETRAVALSEQALRQKQADDERKDRLIKNCMAAAGILIPSLITVWGTVKSFEFEREGTITTTLGRGFINKLLPKK